MSALPSTTATTARAVLPRIVNHDIPCCSQAVGPGNHLSSGRALGLTRADDVLQLHPDLQTEWGAILAHYRRIGIDHTEQIVWDLSPDIACAYPQHQLSVFAYGDSINRCRPDPAWRSVVERTRHRNQFVDLAERLQMRVPRTLRYDDAHQVEHLDRLPYPCYVKAAVGLPGVGCQRCETPAEVRTALATFEPGVALQIQQAVDSDLCIHLQYQVREGVAVPQAASERWQDDHLLPGSRYPARHAPWAAVEPMARWMAGHGMQGSFVFDVAVARTPDGPGYWPIACHPRYHDTAYPTAIAKRLGLDAWLAVQMDTRCRHLAEIYLEDLEFQPATGRGVVIVNWGTIAVGRLGVLIAGSEQEQQRLRHLLHARLLC